MNSKIQRKLSTRSFATFKEIIVLTRHSTKTHFKLISLKYLTTLNFRTVFKNEVCQRKDQLQDIKHIQELRTFLSKLLSR